MRRLLAQDTLLAGLPAPVRAVALSAFVSITVARQQGNRTPFRFLIPPGTIVRPLRTTSKALTLMNLQKIEFTKTIISKVSYPHAVIPGLQACPGMIEAGGIHWLLDLKMDSCFRRNDKRVWWILTSYDFVLRRHKKIPSLRCKTGD
jgi:hypothetical protein